MKTIETIEIMYLIYKLSYKSIYSSVKLVILAGSRITSCYMVYWMLWNVLIILNSRSMQIEKCICRASWDIEVDVMMMMRWREVLQKCVQVVNQLSVYIYIYIYVYAQNR